MYTKAAILKLYEQISAYNVSKLFFHRYRFETLKKRVEFVVDIVEETTKDDTSASETFLLICITLEEVLEYLVLFSNKSKELASHILKYASDEEQFSKWADRLKHCMAEMKLDAKKFEAFDKLAGERDYEMDVGILQCGIVEMLILLHGRDNEVLLKTVNALVSHQSNMRSTFRAKTDPTSTLEINPKKIVYDTVIGHGSFGVVWRARYKGDPVAIKSIPIQSLTKQSIAELNAEANIMRRLSHSRIVSCFGVFEFDGNHCIAMELMEGGSLQDYIAERPCPTEWLSRYDIALDICHGMSYLHRLNVIHRDLKPGNVVLDAFGRAKITDFGLSIIKTTAVTSVKGHEMGTVQYMAPECFGLEPVFSPKVDVFAFSVILWELGHWQFAYKEVNAKEIKESIKSGQRLDVEALVPSLMSKMIKDCWVDNPRSRPDFVALSKLIESEITNIQIDSSVVLEPTSIKSLVHSGNDTWKPPQSLRIRMKSMFNFKSRKWRKLVMACGVITAVLFSGLLAGIVIILQQRRDVVPPEKSVTSSISATTNIPRPRQQCAAGFYSSDGKFCEKCSGGYFSSEGSTNCTLCPAGQYSNPGSSGCNVCSEGFYSDPGSSNCTQCAGGLYSNAGSGSCSQCLAGNFSLPGSSNCTLCSGGYYSESGASSCIQCDAGYFSQPGSSNCTICPNGYYSNSTSSECAKCSAGTYAAGDSQSCIECAAGYYSSEASTNCSKCSAGYFSDSGSSDCTACSAGYFSFAGNSSCFECAAGSYSSTEGSSSCSLCPAGYYSAAGSLNCTICSAGYRSNQGSASCDQCNPGSFSSAGSSVCNECPAGTYAGLTSSNCTQCLGGSYSNVGASSCITCSGGYAALPGSSSCTLCPAGYYALEGSSTCDICPTETFSSAGSSSCTTCPLGFNSTAGSSSCNFCASGYYVIEGITGNLCKPPGYVSTIAGRPGIIGSLDGPGVSAVFYTPRGIAIDSFGEFYIADYNNHKIRKMNSTGYVTTVAGNGTIGAVDGQGLSATFYRPAGLATDSLGNVYVSEYSSNHKIRKINSTGFVSTFAGSGVRGSADGQGLSATFNRPSGLVFDSLGNLYIADTDNHKIRKINSTGFVSTFAGTGSFSSFDGPGTTATFNSPYGVAVDLYGNVIVADTYSHKIRRINATGFVTTIAGSGMIGTADGQGTAATFYYPHDVTADSHGNLYVADSNNQLIRKINSTGYVSTLAGLLRGSNDGQGSEASFNAPRGAVFDPAGYLYVTQTGGNTVADWSHMVRKIVLGTEP